MANLKKEMIYPRNRSLSWTYTGSPPLKSITAKFIPPFRVLSVLSVLIHLHNTINHFVCQQSICNFLTLAEYTDRVTVCAVSKHAIQQEEQHNGYRRSDF